MEGSGLLQSGAKLAIIPEMTSANLCGKIGCSTWHQGHPSSKKQSKKRRKTEKTLHQPTAARQVTLKLVASAARKPLPL